MKIAELWKKKSTTFSFEFFPPKTDEEGTLVLETARSLKSLDPDYISVTWGAGGGTRRKTLDLVSAIKNDVGIETMAHLTCVGAGRRDVDEILEEMGRRGVQNILALRGDPPRGSAQFEPHPDGFRHASELVRHIRARLDACLGVAGYPEGHPECPDLNKDLDHLKFKVDQGADFVVTQLFFDPTDFLRFRDRAMSRGVRVPLVAGVMPITNVGQVKRFTTLCGARIPSLLESALDRAQGDADAVLRLGIDHAIQQCRTLLSEDVSGIHFYTLNRSRSTTEILRQLRPKK
jgi:methylenetetrahydrofolate reductase (NADPH)